MVSCYTDSTCGATSSTITGATEPFTYTAGDAIVLIGWEATNSALGLTLTDTDGYLFDTTPLTGSPFSASVSGTSWAYYIWIAWADPTSTSHYPNVEVSDAAATQTALAGIEFSGVSGFDSATPVHAYNSASSLSFTPNQATAMMLYMADDVPPNGCWTMTVGPLTDDCHGEPDVRPVTGVSGYDGQGTWSVEAPDSAPFTLGISYGDSNTPVVQVGFAIDYGSSPTAGAKPPVPFGVQATDTSVLVGWNLTSWVATGRVITDLTLSYDTNPTLSNTADIGTTDPTGTYNLTGLNVGTNNEYPNDVWVQLHVINGSNSNDSNVTVVREASPVGSGSFLAFYDPIQSLNITPPYWAGGIPTVNGTEVVDNIIGTKFTPAHTLGLYYIANITATPHYPATPTPTLVYYDVATSHLTTLHTWYINAALANFVIGASQLPNGSIFELWSIGAYGGTGWGGVGNNYVWLQWYDLLNDTYGFVNTTAIDNAGSGPDGLGIAQGGYYGNGWFFVDLYPEVGETQMEAFNVWSSTALVGSVIDYPFNSPVLEASTGTIVMDDNSASQINLLTWNVTCTDTCLLNQVQTNSAAVYSFVNGADTDNMPYYYTTLPNGTTLLWGIGANNGNAPFTNPYHNIGVYMYPDMTKDRFAYVTDTYTVGTSDISPYASEDNSGYFFNGGACFNDYGYGRNQAMLLDPNNFTEIYSSTEPWLNDYAVWGVYAAGGCGIANGWLYLGYSGYDGIMVNGTTVTYYWDAAQTGEFSDRPQATSLMVTGVGFTTISLSWTNPPVPFTNLTLEYGTDSVTLGTNISLGTVSTYTVTGLFEATTYYFVVVAWNGSAVGLPSNEASATTNSSHPPPPPAVGPNWFVWVVFGGFLAIAAILAMDIGRRLKRHQWGR